MIVNLKLRRAICNPAVNTAPMIPIIAEKIFERNPGLIINKTPKKAIIKITHCFKVIFSLNHILTKIIVKNGLNCLSVIAK